MLSAEQVRAKLAEYVRDQARHREAGVDQRPDDARSRRSVERLWRLAAHVEALPDDDIRLAAVSQVHAQHEHDALVVGEDARYLVSRFAFDADDATQGVDEFLTKFVTVLVAADRRDQLDQLGDQLRSGELDTLLERLRRADDG